MADSLRMALLESRLVGSTGQNGQVLSTENGFLDRSNSMSNSALFEDTVGSMPVSDPNTLRNIPHQESPRLPDPVIPPASIVPPSGRGYKRKDTPDNGSSGEDSKGRGSGSNSSTNSTRVTRKSTKTQQQQLEQSMEHQAKSSSSSFSASGSGMSALSGMSYSGTSRLSRKKSGEVGQAQNNQKAITSFWPNDTPSAPMLNHSSSFDSNPSNSTEFSEYTQTSTTSAGGTKKSSPVLKKGTKAQGRAPTPTNLKPSASMTPAQQLQKIHQLEQKLEERSRESEARVAHLQQRLAEVTQEAEHWKTKSKLIIETLVKERADVTAEDLRQRHTVDSHRLGKFVLQRISSMSGSGISEYWEDGRAMREIKDAQGALLAREEAIKKFNRDKIKAAKEAAKSMKNNPSQEENIEDLLVHEAEESAKSRLATLKRDQTRLAEDRAKLEKETLVYRREVKRCALEDRSKFKRGTRTGANGEYILTNLLGKGGFSEVWKAFDLVRLSDVAVKVHQLSDSWGEEKKASYTKHATREYRIHKDLSHQHVVKLFDVFEINSNAFATVLESCEGGDLDHRLKSEKIIPEADAKPILLQVIAGLRYLNTPNNASHTKAIIHYDLKPGNILFDDKGDAKITDFGLSKIVDGSHDEADIELTSQGTGTYWYLPPECFRISPQGAGGPRISSKVDVWSLGVIYYQMLYGKRPFGEGESQEQLLRNNTMLSAGVPQFPEKPKVSYQAKEFLKACLSADQSMRPDVLELCRNPYLRAPSKNK